MATNNHTNAIISQVNIGNTLYDIHDSNAIHTLADLGSLGMDTSGVFVFKGTVATVADLPTTGNQVGHVYHVTANHSEYIWAKVDGASAEGWEEFGEHFVVSHTHDIPALSGSINSNGSAAAQVWTQQSGSINSNGSAAAQVWTQGTSSVTMAGSNAASTVTGTTPVAVTTPSHKYLSAALSENPSLTPETDTVLGAGTTFTASGVTVASSGTKANAITGFGTHTTAAAITALNSTTVQEVKSITPGSAATWSASVDDGVLSFSFTANTPTAVTKGASSSLATPTAKSTANAITALGTPSTTACLTGVAVTNQPTITVGTNDQVAAMTSATVSKPSITLTANSSSATGRIKYTETTSESNESRDLVNGSAAAQKWTQGTTTINVTGTNAASKVTGGVTVTGTNAASKVTGGITTVANTTGQPE